jgi:hypothetical protein
MTKQFLLRSHSSVFTALPIFGKCSEAVADRRDGARRGRVGLSLEHNWASGCVGCSDDGCGGGGGDDDDDEGTGHVTIKAAALLPSNSVHELLGRSLQPQASVTHVCAMQQTCVRHFTVSAVQWNTRQAASVSLSSPRFQ